MKETRRLRATRIRIIDGYPVTEILDREPIKDVNGKYLENYAIITRREIKPMK